MIVRNKNGSFDHRLAFLNKPICRIPSLAIHLDRSVSEKFSFNAETHLLPVLASVTKGVLEGADKKSDHHPVLIKVCENKLFCEMS